MPSGGCVTGAPASGTNDRTDPRVPPPDGVFDVPRDDGRQADSREELE